MQGCIGHPYGAAAHGDGFEAARTLVVGTLPGVDFNPFEQFMPFEHRLAGYGLQLLGGGHLPVFEGIHLDLGDVFEYLRRLTLETVGQPDAVELVVEEKLRLFDEGDETLFLQQFQNFAAQFLDLGFLVFIGFWFQLRHQPTFAIPDFFDLHGNSRSGFGSNP